MKFVLENSDVEQFLQPVAVIGSGAYGTVFKALMTPVRSSTTTVDPSDAADGFPPQSNHFAASQAPPPPHQHRRTAASAAAGASQQQQETFVAVKQVCFDDVPDEVSDLMKELRVLSVAQHPNIPKFLGSVLTDVNHIHSAPVASSSAAVLNQGKFGPGNNNKGPGPNPPSSSNLQFSTKPSMCIVQELIEGGTLAEYYSGGHVPQQVGGGLSQLLLNKNRPGVGGNLNNSNASQQSMNDPTGAAGLSGSGGPSSLPKIVEEEVGTVVMDVLKALVHLHEDCRIVHRDVKCSNLLLSVRDGRVKLCDFGTSVAMPSSADQRTTVIGTPGWMAPEVWASGGTHSFASDVWSLGVSVLEMTMMTTAGSDPLFNQYVQTISLMPCSTQKDGPQPANNRSSTFSALNELRSHPAMLDFVACCLRRNPLQRPTARWLLEHHPLITTHALVHNPARKTGLIKSMGDSVLAVKRRLGLLLDGSAHHSPSPSSALSGGGGGLCSPVSGPPSQQQQQQQQQGNVGPGWCLPPHVANIVSSEPFRYIPNTLYSEPSGPTTTTSGKIANNSGAAGTKGAAVPSPFQALGQVIVPATAQSRATMQGVFGVYRSVMPLQPIAQAGPAATATTEATDDAADGPSAPVQDDSYTLAELQGNQVSYEEHEALFDQLLSAFHRADAALVTGAAKVASGASFTSLFLESFVSTMLSNEDDAVDLRYIMQQHKLLQENPLRHCYYRQRRSSSGSSNAASLHSGSPLHPQSSQQQQHPTVPPIAGSPFPPPSQSQPREVVPFTMQDWIKAPSIPLSHSSSSMTTTTTMASAAAAAVPNGVGVRSNHHTNSSSAASSVNISSLLYNRWLADYKRTTFQQK